MIKITSISRMILLLCSLCSFQAVAGDNSQDSIDALYGFINTPNYSSLFSVESRPSDPGMRTGTQNSESPQGGFFVVPAIIVGLFALTLFFKEK